MPPVVERFHSAQHPDPWIGKTQNIRLWNILVLGPASIYVGRTGKYSAALRALALVSGPLLMWRNWHNFNRLEAQRELEGRPEGWWQDEKAMTSQGFRIMDFGVLGPLLVYTALGGEKTLTPALRQFALWTGVITVAYNLRNYVGIRAQGGKTGDLIGMMREGLIK